MEVKSADPVPNAAHNRLTSSVHPGNMRPTHVYHMPTESLAIRRIEFWPIDVPMTDPFVVATGVRLTAENVFVRVTLSSGVQGYGEAAPFPEVGGETRDSCLNALKRLAELALTERVDCFIHLAGILKDDQPHQPAARCGLETAVVDAYCRCLGIPMWKLWGGADVRKRESDITIPICDMGKTIDLGRRWYGRGFRLFKMKVGKDVEEDIRRVEALHRALRGIAFIGDGNQGFTRDECSAFVKGVKRFGGILTLLEQPLPRNDLEGLAAVRRDTGIPVAADESVRSLDDAHNVVTNRAADFINIKIMKTGLVEAREIAAYTLSSGLRLMVGGMVETRVAMGCSFSLVLAIKGFEILDLDTPLLLANDPIMGGYRYEDAELAPWHASGLDLSVKPSQTATVIERE